MWDNHQMLGLLANSLFVLAALDGALFPSVNGPSICRCFP